MRLIVSACGVEREGALTFCCCANVTNEIAALNKAIAVLVRAARNIRVRFIYTLLIFCDRIRARRVLSLVANGTAGLRADAHASEIRIALLPPQCL